MFISVFIISVFILTLFQHKICELEKQKELKYKEILNYKHFNSPYYYYYYQYKRMYIKISDFLKGRIKNEIHST
jgi:hypothetical protein